jgi:hypothetical protein
MVRRLPIEKSDNVHNEDLDARDIYVLVQSFNKDYRCLKVIGLIGSKSDPCVWTEWYENVLILIYFDDCLF